jgi:hypothetical protein
VENTALLADQLNLKIDSGIQTLTTTIEGMASAIEGLKSADIILTNNQKDAALRFHVETKLGGSWPLDTLITYETKLSDTHNAMNTETGIFTAPFSGMYGFVFYGRIFCNYEGIRDLYVDHSGARSIIFRCDTHFSDDHPCRSVYFALSLKQGDTVAIFAGNTIITSDIVPAKFTGFLLQKE